MIFSDVIKVRNTFSDALQSKATQTASRQSHMGGISMGFAFFVMFAMYGLIIYFGGW
jgi:hypothetical protein